MGYGKEIYEKAQEELNSRRQRAFTDLEARRSRIYEELPQVRTLEEKLAHTGVAAARAVFAGGSTKEILEKLREENLQTQDEIRTILASRGYVPSDLEEHYVCPQCRDKGYIDGRMCSCMKTLLRTTAYSELNARSPLSLENSGFDSFSLEWYSDKPSHDGTVPRRKMERIFAFCRDYAEKFNKQSRSVLMEGSTGLGKTHLSLAIAGRVIDRGFGVIYGSAPDLLSQLERENFSRDSERTVLERLEQCDLLILDDLGTEFTNSFTRAAVYNLINNRLARERATIINTNLSLGEMKRSYSDRLISRIVGDHCYFQFAGEDVRIAKKRARVSSGTDSLW